MKFFKNLIRLFSTDIATDRDIANARIGLLVDVEHLLADVSAEHLALRRRVTMIEDAMIPRLIDAAPYTENSMPSDMGTGQLRITPGPTYVGSDPIRESNLMEGPDYSVFSDDDLRQGNETIDPMTIEELRHVPSTHRQDSTDRNIEPNL
jgi:hypothetical protein